LVSGETSESPEPAVEAAAPSMAIDRAVRTELVLMSDVTVTSKPEDRPEFERIYQASLPRSCALKVRLYTSSFGTRSDMSEITQWNGRWVLFDVHRPADKIIDRELLPEIERLCTEIVRMDRAFLASDPREYVDEQGHRWWRAK
jgi:hypothetical protein